MNTQPIEKQDLRKDGELDVFRIFHTIQGEGPFTGHVAVFVRLAGCNLQCPLCDTDYTSERRRMAAEEVCAQVLGIGAADPLVVITGGEPFRQNLEPLVTTLLDEGLRVQIETNGTLYQDLPYWRPELVIVCSPKAGKIHPKLEPHLDALKYVLHADSCGDDGLPLRALDHPCHPRLARPTAAFSGTIYLQPVDTGDVEDNRRHLAATVASVMKHEYVLCTQVHKAAGLE